MRYQRSEALAARARQLVPGGGHLSGRALVELAPRYMTRGKGCRIWDADGHEYIDYLMAFGPFLLGYANEEVDAAAIAQLKNGNLLSMHHPLHLEFIERLISRFQGADMGVFLKTGSEATTVALRIARRATGRRSVARCGYHGWHDWCLPLESWVPTGLDGQVHEFRDPASLERLMERHPGEIAAVIIAPEMFIPTDGATFHRLAQITRDAGALLVMDEIKTAFRIAPGSIQERVGLVPDITTVSKALGNGWPIAAVIGGREVMEAGAGMHYSATFHGDTASMAAAMMTLSIIDRSSVTEHVWRLGERLIDGLNGLVRQHRVEATAFGEPLPPMPFLRFNHPDPEHNARVSNAFYTAVLEHGVLLHPRHMWFISLAHGDDDITRTLEVCDQAMRRAASA